MSPSWSAANICSLAFNDVFTLNFISFSFSVVGNMVTLLPPVIAPSVVVMLSGSIIFMPFFCLCFC